MKIIKYTLLFLLTISVLVTLNWLRAFTEIKVTRVPTAGPAETALSDAVSLYKRGEVSIVDLSTIVAFPWDRVYIFGPFTELSKIDAAIGKPWRDVCFTTIDSYEGYALLIFTNNHQAVDCIEYPRGDADFASLEVHENGFSPEEARFILDERANMIWVGNK